jgi:hypothetical protein
MTDHTNTYPDLVNVEDWLNAKGYTGEAGACHQAMSLIRKLETQNEELRAILNDWVKCAISVEIRDYGQPGYEEAMKAFRKARRATYKYERERC